MKEYNYYCYRERKRIEQDTEKTWARTIISIIQGKNDKNKTIVLLLWQKLKNKQYKIQEKNEGRQNNTRRVTTMTKKEKRKKNYSQILPEENNNHQESYGSSRQHNHNI